MSKVPSYCLCSDDKYYKNPVWCPEAGPRDWFLCLDDDDPPELVVRKSKEVPSLSWFVPGRMYTGAMRVFSYQGIRFEEAKSCFGRLIEIPPPPQEYSAVYDSLPVGDKVVFDVERWKIAFPLEYQSWLARKELITKSSDGSFSILEERR